jgi:phage/plasmid-associated DNA primase/5S rRNA maturation endonuclease (ribonuclease M5)
LDFGKYKNRLLEYLHLKGFNVRLGSDFCFVPSHDNKNTPAAYYNEDGFICYSPNCVCTDGKYKDIYDAVEILEGITDKKEQYLYLERIFGGDYVPPPAFGKEGKNQKEKFTADPEALKKIEDYLNKNSAAEKEIIKFLNMRAAVSTLGKIKSYPADLIPAMVKNFLYWPGLDIVKKDIDINTIFEAGIPLKGRDNLPSFWEHSGVILKLGSGFKLHYYMDGDCKKYGSKDSHTFPMPGKIDETRPVVLVEGEMDAVSSVAAGIENLFSTGGTNGLTGPKLKKHEYAGIADLLKTPEIIFCFDSDEPGRKASGLIPYEAADKERTNRPEILRMAGYTGKIKIAELPVNENENEHDQDALVIAGKRDIILKAIQKAKEYIPPEKKANGKTEAKWDFLSFKRLQSILKKLPRKDLKTEDIQAFITAIYKASKNKGEIEKELLKWGATKDEIKNENEFTPYELIETAWSYGFTKYIQKTIEIELTPASELLKKIKWHKPIVDIDYEGVKENKNITQFMTTKGVRSAALFVSDVLDGRMIYTAADERFYFFNGHVWLHQPDMTGIIFNIVSAVMYYFIKYEVYSKTETTEVINKIESRHFRMDVTKEFSQLKDDGVWKEYINFDGPEIKETITLINGVMDFSGNTVIYRNAKREEYRRHILPYRIEDFKNDISPDEFFKFMRGNFKNNDTLETLMYFLSLIASRNTQFKVAGFFIGKTNTGKTTTISIMEAIYPDMIQGLPSSILVGKGDRHINGNQPNPFLAQLEGKGAGVANETERNTYLNTSLFKEITGGGSIITRDLFKTAHPFIPTAQIIMTTNDPPRFDSHDDATIGRMIIVPFMIQHNKEKEKNVQPDEFIDKFRHEFPAIIRVFAEYYIKLKTKHNRLIPLSDECKRYKNNYVEDQDTDLDKFVKQHIEFTISEEKQTFEKVVDVYHRYLRYYGFVDETGNPDEKHKDALSRNKFTRYLKKDYMTWGLTYKQKKINGYPELCFFNIRLVPWDGIKDEPIPQELEPKKEPKETPPPEDDPFN